MVFCVCIQHACYHHPGLNGHWTTFDPTRFLGHLLGNLILCEVPEADGVILALEDLCCSFGKLPFKNTICVP